ncbi:MAG: hypothetical protein ING20_02395 [Burkholderiales bacterium]|nr:hypothetical protein [Burkholderiales bacterium]
MKMSDAEINKIVGAEEDDAINFQSQIGRDRAKLLDYYNCRPYGDEVEGQSQVVTSDVSDVIEGMLPSLVRIFTQGKYVARFESDNPEYDKEADQKTAWANYVFTRQNDGTLILHNMFKDALLQYTGTVKIYWDEKKDVTKERYRGLSLFELQKLQMDEETEIEEQEERIEVVQGTPFTVYDVQVKRTKTIGQTRIDNVPPEEFLICRSARDFRNPRFIGHRTPKTRSELILMGFDRDTVENLPADEYYDFEVSYEKNARYWNYDGLIETNPGDASQDIIYLGEYYVYMDTDGDGVAELWQVFRAGNEILDKNQVDEHPFAVVVPIPIPHRAIGSCPGEQVADIQYLKSTLMRQALNNVYQTNYMRTIVNERVDLDDLLTPRAGGIIRVNDEGPIGDSLQPLVVQPIAEPILRMMEYVDVMREVRTGVTRYNQGLDSEALNKTATGFKGIMEASQQRLDMIARIFADTGVRDIFRKIIKLGMQYQNDSMQIRVMGTPMEIDPTSWRNNLDCRIDVGLGSGDRQEKIVNLNAILAMQQQFLQQGLPLADQAKMYNTLEKLVVEVGLKDASPYFNDPTQPQQMLQAQVEQLSAAVQQLQAQMQNPLAEVEQIKAQASLAEQQQKQQFETQKLLLEMEQKRKEFETNYLTKLTELELKYGQNVPGALV